MRSRHLSKLTGNTRNSYLFPPDSTNSIEMKELDVIAKPKNKRNDLILNLTPENVTQHSRIE